jgi:molybdopterin-guanine dinucleotide biosynthesis protein A
VVGTRPILERQLTLLQGLTPHILIVGRDRGNVQTGGIPVTLIADHIPGAGALGGLYSALMAAPTEQVLVIACDMPWLTAPFLTHLAERGHDVDVAVPRDARGRHPLCASYARRIAGHLHGRIAAGHLRVLDALTGLTVRDLAPEELAPFDRDGRLLCNVNTPEDYDRARA